jgi:thioredoxin-like negative regulator of GroEL
MKQVNEAQFSSEVLLPSFNRPIAVLFSAEWCGPCKVIKPRIERLSALHAFPVTSVDAGVEKPLAAFYGVRAVPTLAIFREGKVVGATAGAGNLGEADMIVFLNEHGFKIVTRPEMDF